MRKSLCVGALALSFLVSSLAALPAAAKSVDGMRARIPFDFHVGGRLVRAGAYTVKSLTADEQVIRLQSGREVATTTTNSANERGNGEGRARLVFHRYGDQYFLSEVWTGVDQYGLSLPASRAERQIKSGDMAKVEARRVTVALNARR